MLSKISLRLKLSDFINTDIEQTVMDMINAAHLKLNSAVILYLWYDEDELSLTELKTFLMKWDSKLHFKTIVTSNSKMSNANFIWYDIIPDEYYTERLNRRFAYKYFYKTDILNGLKEFYKCAKFIISDKPPRKQKRNDYEG
jgi:hypothetical protein|tara:strand:+ start:240 stop:665 length:426 start_codon:yes stop_codon:yes gene_type:complete